jgi:hypothetical protein
VYLSIVIKNFLLLTLLSLYIPLGRTQIINYDLQKLKKDWGRWDFEKANTARFAFYMNRSQKRTMLYMNLARQDGSKFTELVATPYILENPNKKYLYSTLKNAEMHMLYPSFRLWLGALPHAIVSGITGAEGHAGFKVRMYTTLNLNIIGENCDYGHYKGLDVTLHLLTSPGHRANILNKEFSRAAVSKAPHIEYKWNSVTTFSGPKFFDLIFRGHNKIKHLQANLSIATDLKQYIIDISFGGRYNNVVNSARYSIGAEIIPRIDRVLIAPKVQWSSEYYFFGFGASVFSFASFDYFGIIARPEISYRLPYDLKLSKRSWIFSYNNIEKSKSSIGISYGYNINFFNNIIIPLGKHQITLTYSRNFYFKEGKW